MAEDDLDLGEYEAVEISDDDLERAPSMSSRTRLDASMRPMIYLNFQSLIRPASQDQIRFLNPSRQLSTQQIEQEFA